MRNFKKIWIIAIFFTLSNFTHEAKSREGRRVFLNGVDISGSIEQKLERVDMHINGNGDIYINAPHYQVFEEDHYLPLSRQSLKSELPVHREKSSLQGAKKFNSPSMQNDSILMNSKNDRAMPNQDTMENKRVGLSDGNTPFSKLDDSILQGNSLPVKDSEN